jgi:hypothetical protein
VRKPLAIINSQGHGYIEGDTTKSTSEVYRSTSLDREQRFLEHSRHFALKAFTPATDQHATIRIIRQVASQSGEAFSSGCIVSYGRRLLTPAFSSIDRISLRIKAHNLSMQSQVIRLRLKHLQCQLPMFRPCKTNSKRSISSAIALEFPDEKGCIAIRPEMTAVREMPTRNENATRNLTQREFEVHLEQPKAWKIWAFRYRNAQPDPGECISWQ